MNSITEIPRIPRCFILIVVLSQNARSEESEKDDLDLIYGSEEMQSIAAGHPIPQNLSPSVTSVITSKDIDRIGARQLLDVLEYLPGVHVSTARSGHSVIGFRGIYSETNSQVLILINGIPLRNNLIGGKPLEWTMPVKNISHIEVIRGPGSMLYGGDATTGVINVVLKTGKALQGGDVGGFFGSQDTYQGWAEYGNQKGDWEYAFAFQDGTTTGNRGKIDQDAQTLLDRQFGTHVSNAPGYSNNGRGDIDARIDVAYKDWIRLRAGYQGFDHVQTNEGAALALDNTGWTNEDIYNLDLSLNQKVSDALTNNTTFYFLGQQSKADVNLLPAGTMGGLLPQGEKSLVSGFQGTTGLTTQFNYAGIKKHYVTAGTGLIYNWIADPSNKINAIITPAFIQQINLTEVSALGIDPLQKTKNRTNFYALIQDEWNFATDFYLTTGLRYDYYSDLEPGFSPRASLVWNVNPYLTTKLLYSRAFRPPSFFEKNQPLNPGTNIKSETVNTVEFQVENRWSPDLKTSTNVYWFELDNLITSINATAANPVAFINNQPVDGVGLETEGHYQFNDHLTLSVNYSYQGLPNRNAIGFLPGHMIKALINWEFTKGWILGSQLNWIGERKRPANDPRPNLGDYFIAGLTLSTKIAEPLEFSLRANNIFGTNAKEPSINPFLLPGDVPVTGRSVLGQIKWSF